MQNLGQSGPYNCFFFFFLLITSFKFAPKSIHQNGTISVSKIQNFPASGGAHPPQSQTPPLCAEASIWHCDAPPPQQIITKKKKKNVKKMDLGSWLGGTCNFEVGEEFGEGFCRQHLVLGNNSDFLEE